MNIYEEAIKLCEEELNNSVKDYNDLIDALISRMRSIKFSMNVDDIRIEDIRERMDWNPFDYRANNAKIKTALKKIYDVLTLKYEHEVDWMRLQQGEENNGE